MKRDYLFYDVAKSVSKTSTHERVSIGAILVLGKEIISVACNENKSHPEQYRLNKFRFNDENSDRCKNGIHAELKCILSCKEDDLSRAKLYVYREDRKGHIANCRPCPACMEKIKETGIRDIYYTTEDGHAHERLK
jgi:hypothetical protein